MPFKYALEMICDYLGAGKAYAGDNFTMNGEYDWWLSKKDIVKMHKDTFTFTCKIMDHMKEYGIEETLKNKEYINELRSKY